METVRWLDWCPTRLEIFMERRKLGGYGTVFELSPCTGNEKCRNGYFYRLRYSFTGEPDGKRPLAGVILDQAGNLYGTTAYGGTGVRGTVFKLSPSQGSWQESVIYSFRGFDDGNGAVGWPRF